MSSPDQSPDEHKWIAISIDRKPDSDSAADPAYILQQRSNIVPIPFCIFKLPKPLSTSPKPQYFSPQIISFGPYHHSRHDLLTMQPFKLSAAKFALSNSRFPPPTFPEVVRMLELLAPEIRQCYHNHLTADDSTLAEIMAMDGLFLLELICFNGGNLPSFANSRVFLSSQSRRRIELGFYRDVMMVENQIPIFVLQDIAAAIGGRYESPAVLSSGLIRFCRRFSPLELKSSYPVPKIDDAEPLHLLDLLYNLILLKRVEEDPDPYPQLGFLESVYHLQHPLVLAFLWPVKHLTLIVPKILSAIPILNNLIDLNVKKVAAPIISSASELRRAGVKLQAGSGSVRDISFRSRALTIPKFTWNPSCQVILRNLVAYESMAKSEEETLILTQYGKLMDGLIRSEEDVGLLREVGIVICGDQDIVDAVSAFSGIGESIGIKDEGLMRTVRDLRIFHANSHNLRTFFWVCVVVLVVAAIVEVYSLEKAPSGSTKPILGIGRRVHPAGSWQSSKLLAAIIQSFKIINMAGPFTTKSTILSD